MIGDMPVSCACESVKHVHADFLTNEVKIVCECGTVLRVNQEDLYTVFLPASEARRSREEHTCR